MFELLVLLRVTVANASSNPTVESFTLIELSDKLGTETDILFELVLQRIECAEWSVVLIAELAELRRCISSFSSGVGVPVIGVNIMYEWLWLCYRFFHTWSLILS